ATGGATEDVFASSVHELTDPSEQPTFVGFPSSPIEHGPDVTLHLQTSCKWAPTVRPGKNSSLWSRSARLIPQILFRQAQQADSGQRGETPSHGFAVILEELFG